VNAAEVVTVQHLVKRYGNVLVVTDVSFSIREGEMFGIIGPNGTGKTTSVECISGLRAPDSGPISVYGLSPRDDRNKVREVVGVQLQESALRSLFPWQFQTNLHNKGKSMGKISGGALLQFARFCVVGTSNAVIDFGVLNAALAVFPTRATVPLLAYNSAAVVLAATNSFVWNRRFTFRVRGPLQAGEVARFTVVALGTAGLNDLVLLALSGLFPALMASGALGANVLKLGAILGALALSFFGMRCWVFIGRRLSSGPSAKARDLPSSSYDDRTSKDSCVQESLSVVSLKQRVEV